MKRVRRWAFWTHDDRRSARSRVEEAVGVETMAAYEEALRRHLAALSRGFVVHGL